MKIGVLEWNVGAMGGRQKTMLCFADFLIEKGHDVSVYSNWLEGDIAHDGSPYNRETFLSWHGFSFLEYKHFNWVNGLKRQYEGGGDLPVGWKSLDILLIPYGGYGYLQALLPKTRVISWVIHPDQARYSIVKDVWTNSRTTAERLYRSKTWKTSNPEIVVPPHDYSSFRKSRIEYDKREFDAMTVGSMLYGKGILDFADLCLDGDYRGIIISSTWSAAKEENDAVLQSLSDRGIRPNDPSSNVILRLNTPKDFVSEAMGNSKALISFSRAESCPLVVYEAMSSGCHIVSRDVGAIKEQTSRHGRIFSSNDEAANILRSALRHDVSAAQDRWAMSFDRRFVGHKVECEINK